MYDTKQQRNISFKHAPELSLRACTLLQWLWLCTVHIYTYVTYRWSVACLRCCEQMSRLSLRLRLQITSAAAMSSRVVMGRVFHCRSAVIGLNITVLMALMSSTVVRCLYYRTLVWYFNIIYTCILLGLHALCAYICTQLCFLFANSSVAVTGMIVALRPKFVNYQVPYPWAWTDCKMFSERQLCDCVAKDSYGWMLNAIGAGSSLDQK